MKVLRLTGPLAAVLLAVPALAAPPDILAGRDTVSLTLAAPLADLRTRGAEDAKATVDGTLRLDSNSGAGATVAVRISERGHTSRNPSECAFPKLRVEFVSSDRTGTPFEGLDVLKIGTHCGDAAPGTLTPKYGRLANESAPRREAMVYAMLAAVGIPTLRTRPARITYEDTAASGTALVTRFALLLEDDDAAAARLGATAVLDEDTFGSASVQFSDADTARLAFAEALIGNFDWCLRMFPGDIYRCDDRHPLWNILGLAGTGPKDIPLPYDFDLAGPVVGRHIWFPQVFDEAFVEPPSSVRVEVLAQVQRTRSLFSRPLLDAVRAAFMRSRADIDAVIAAAEVDEEGRRQAREYTAAFYDAVGDDREFYRTVVVDVGHQAWVDADGRTPACGADNSIIPAGTPVGPPLAVRNGRTQVRVLDALWKWTGDNRCDRVHREPVWIDADALGVDYPQ